jgi:cytochrome o ubiquinol oxidase operon protein cyoD
MNEHTELVVGEHDTQHVTLARYVIGFAGSIGLTLLAYFLVTNHVYSKNVIIGTISTLAVIQFIVQMVFFLHIGEERKPRWKLMVMIMMLSVVLILVLGSIWIMNNLNYRMNPQQMTQYLKDQNGGI